MADRRWREFARGDGDHRDNIWPPGRRADLGRDRMGTRRKPSVLGMISGAVAGLGTITPASGFVAPWHGVLDRRRRGNALFLACTCSKQRLKYDDSLDVFGVHGVGGLTGTLLAGGVCGERDRRTAGLIEGNAQQV